MFTNRSISRIFSVLFILVFMLAQVAPVYAAGAWTSTATFSGSVRHTATLLADGQVLIAGGGDSGFPNANAKLYNPTSDAWIATGSLTIARYSHTATLLPNGKVLVVGGDSFGFFLSSAELYDPSTGSWSATGSLLTARRSHTATLLSNGKVLVAGGYGQSGILTSAELYDPATGLWASTGALAFAHGAHTATLLTNGKVLVVGWGSAELYDLTTGLWAITGAPSQPGSGHTATLLPNGMILIAGGYISGGLSSAELYNPATGVWTTTGSMAGIRSYHQATLLANGKVLVVGGFGSSGTLASAELYDPSTGTWASTDAMIESRYYHTLTRLLNNQILAAGGRPDQYSTASAELFSSPPDNTAPTFFSFTFQTPSTSPTNASILTFRATFSEDVQNIDVADFVINSTTTAVVTGVNPVSTYEYDVTVSGGNLNAFEGTVNLNLASTQDIADLADNALPASEPATDQSYTVDNVAPIVSIFTATSPSSSLNIPITTFTASDGVGATGYIITESSTAPSASDPGWASTAQTTYTVAATGIYTLYPWAKDAAGNVSSIFGSPASVTVDTTPPTVASIVRANANPTNLASVNFTVTFSESVTGVNTGDFVLTTTGVSGTSITSASGLGATYTVSVGTGSGDGTIRLDVVDDDSILDAASNPLNGGFTGGETYNVDKNDAPSSLSLDNTNVAGNLPVGTLVGTFSSTDADIADTFTYSLVSGTDSTDNASFSIAGDQLQTAAVFDSNVKTSYAIRVRTTDSGVGNLFFEQAFTITVTANIVTPNLLTPVDQEALINSRPTFDWTDVLGSTNYHLQIYKAPAFAKSGKVVDITTTSSTYTPTSDLPAGIILYWRVSRNTASGAGPWSVIRSFTIALPPSVPGPVSPKTNAKNVSLTPLFDWSDSTPSAGTILLKYELQISTDSAFTSPLSVDAINSSHTLTTSLNPNTKYYWRVRACNTLGQCSAWSSVRSFTTIP